MTAPTRVRSRARAKAAPLRRPASREQSRARFPESTGSVERNGVRVFYEIYGSGDHTVLFLPTWSIVHSRVWKQQIPYFARHYRVVTFDGRGNGRSDRPADVSAYADTEFVDDAVAVLDATGTPRASIVGVSLGAAHALRMAAECPERVEAAVFEAPAVPLGEGLAERDGHVVDRPVDRYEGWAKYNHHYWRHDYPDFLEFFFGKCFSEPHSTKQIEDAVGWGLETDPETLIRTSRAPWFETDRVTGTEGSGEAVARALASDVSCPSLVVHSRDDAVTSVSRGRELAAALDAELVVLEGSGHLPHARDPVRFNLIVRDFIDRVHRRDGRRAG